MEKHKEENVKEHNDEQHCCQGSSDAGPYDAEYMARLVPRVIAQQTRSKDAAYRTRQIGSYWQGIRREVGKSREQLAASTGVPRYVVALFEQGLIPHEDLPANYIIRLAKALKRIDALDEHIRRYERGYVVHAVRKSDLQWEKAV